MHEQEIGCWAPAGDALVLMLKDLTIKPAKVVEEAVKITGGVIEALYEEAPPAN